MFVMIAAMERGVSVAWAMDGEIAEAMAVVLASALAMALALGMSVAMDL